MGVSYQAQDHDAPPRCGSDDRTHLEMVYAALDVADLQSAAGAPDAPASGAPVSRTTGPGGWPSPDDLTAHRNAAKKGHPASARRVAELYELRDDDTQAATWWRYAAALGDDDAILYVREILDAVER